MHHWARTKKGLLREYDDTVEIIETKAESQAVVTPPLDEDESPRQCTE